METFVKDVRYGCRTLLRNPGFTAIALLSLALGIGANTAIFSFIDTVLLRSLPVRNPQELVLFGTGKGRGNHSGPAGGPCEMFSWTEYQDLRKSNAVFVDILAVDSESNTVHATFRNGAPEGLLSTFVSDNFFDVLGVQPQRGRVFDGRLSPHAVLSDAFWARRFSRDPAVIGQTFRLGQRDFTIVGIAPRNFFGTRVGEAPDMWLPLTMLPDVPVSTYVSLQDPQSHFANIVGRLKSGVTLAAARANVNLVYRQLLPGYIRGNAPAEYKRETDTARIEMTAAGRGLSTLRTRYEEPLIVLMVVVTMVLLIACANVANLLMALGAKRQREMAVRIAIGAGRGRMIRQLLTEGILLSGVAAVLGILVASGAGKVLVHLMSTGPRALPFGFELDYRVLAFTVVLSLLTGVLFGIAPALRASRVDVVSSLKESKASMASLQKVTFGRAMVVGQVALSLALLIAAGMLLRSFKNLIDTDTGFDRESVLVFKIDSDAAGYKQDQRLAALFSKIEEAVSRVPSVASASVSDRSFNEGHWGEGFTVPGDNLRPHQRNTYINIVTPGFFKTFGIPILAGRPLEPRDNAASAPVAVINETFAKQVFGGTSGLGRTFLMAPLTEKDQPYTVVGIARDIKTNDVRDKPENFAYLALAQGPVYAGNIAVRVAGNSSGLAWGLAAGVRKAVHDIEPNLQIAWVTTLADEISDSLVRERAIAQLSSFFATLALLLSAIGLYGTIAFSVARRTGEIGIRLALGADRAGVLTMVLKDAMALVGMGTIIGLPLAFAAGHAMRSLLYGLSGFDIVTSLAAVIALAVVAAFAGYLPARRAANLDPTVALRNE